MTHYWRIRARLPERYGQHCRILVRGAAGTHSWKKARSTIAVEFEDGFRVATSRWFVRRLQA